MTIRTLRPALVVAGMFLGLWAAPSSGPALAADEKAETASDLKSKIVAAVETNTARSLNEARDLLRRLEESLKDAAARKAVGFDDLATRTVQARDTFFRKAVAVGVVQRMTKLIEAKVRETKPSTKGTRPAAAAPEPGTLAAALAWAMRDLPKLLTDGVGADLGLNPDEVERYWEERSPKAARTESYGTGTFIVLKRAAAAGGGARLPTEEDWWAARANRSSERAAWLTAWFIESSGMFEVIRTDETESCAGCDGRGVIVNVQADGTQSSTVCATCNGAAKVRKVVWR